MMRKRILFLLGVLVFGIFNFISFVSAGESFYESFEDGNADGWQISANGGVPYFVTNINAHNSNYSFKAGPSSCGFDCWGSYTVDLTRSITNPYSNYTKISFWLYEQGNWGGQLLLYINDQWVQTFRDGGNGDIDPNTWVKYSYDYNGLIKNITFKFYDITSSDVLYIDDIIINDGEPSCSDNIKNGNETDIDCGGNCGKCGDVKNCLVNSDCLSGYCNNNICLTSNISLIGYWKFNEGYGTIAYDNSLHHNNGQIHNATWATGVEGDALYFSGTDNSYVEVPNKPELNPINRLVIEAWVKPTGYPTWHTAIVHKADSTQTGCFGERSYSLWATSDGGVHFTFTPDGENCQHNYFNTNNLMPINQWSHVKVDLDTEEGKVRIFVNGNKVLEQDASRKPIRNSNLPLRIGGMFRSLSDQSNFMGYIDDVKIYTIFTGPSCSDNIKNGNETDIDCGGNCGKCGDVKNCSANSDCLSNYCKNGLCLSCPIENLTADPFKYDGDYVFNESRLSDKEKALLSYVYKYAREYEISPALIMAITKKESNFNKSSLWGDLFEGYYCKLLHKNKLSNNLKCEFLSYGYMQLKFSAAFDADFRGIDRNFSLPLDYNWWYEWFEERYFCVNSTDCEKKFNVAYGGDASNMPNLEELYLWFKKWDKSSSAFKCYDEADCQAKFSVYIDWPAEGVDVDSNIHYGTSYIKNQYNLFKDSKVYNKDALMNTISAYNAGKPTQENKKDYVAFVLSYYGDYKNKTMC